MSVDAGAITRLPAFADDFIEVLYEAIPTPSPLFTKRAKVTKAN